MILPPLMHSPLPQPSPASLRRFVASSLSSVFSSPSCLSSPAFTLIETLATVAALVILLGMMVSLARHVRRTHAESTTRTLLAELEDYAIQHRKSHGRLPQVPLLNHPDPQSLDPATLRQAISQNNRALVGSWGTDAPVFHNRRPSMFDGQHLRDAWGTPILFIPPGLPNITLAPRSRFFFMSAGPDQDFLEPEDNLYSYERPGPITED